jgi:rSAM/selenodomain-associated transferase 2/rSAM/selenodomain-associated transferase 1
MLVKSRIIVMTRFPEPGKTKSRLIPTISANRAATLHRCLIANTLCVVCQWAEDHGGDVEVRFSGGDEASFCEILGTRCRYVPQSEGSLGTRMNSAVQSAFEDGIKFIVVIGTDCPGLEASHLTQAFGRLRHRDVVIGPATDGGYYLIGMRRHFPELFEKIEWGTETVLRQTLQKCAKAGASLSQLAPLSDVDYAEDLIQCRRAEIQFSSVLPQTAPGRISVVIPTLNEAGNIAATLERLRLMLEIEVIVADGGSTDETVERARASGAIVVHCNRGRGKQMNAGAALASGEVLLFLHADTILPQDFADHIRKTLSNTNSGGAFQLRIGAEGWIFRLIEFAANLRSRWMQLPYGDQAIFLKASQFFQMNGFQNWPLMEDYDFCRRLRRTGSTVIVSASVTTSARRWQRLGVLRTTLTNLVCVIAFRLGVSPKTLAGWYRRPSG